MPAIQKVLDFIQSRPGRTTQEIADGVGGRYDQTTVHLRRLVADGYIVRELQVFLDGKGHERRRNTFFALDSAPAHYVRRPRAKPAAGANSTRQAADNFANIDVERLPLGVARELYQRLRDVFGRD